MTGDVQLPADSEWPSDESLDCRNKIKGGVRHTSKCTCPVLANWKVTWCSVCDGGANPQPEHSANGTVVLTPAQAGIARALRRLCDGAERRMGCAEYQP
jgi:hypothetical protein